MPKYKEVKNGGYTRSGYELVLYNDGNTKQWWLNGKLHREDGHAYENDDGLKAWWLNGTRLDKAFFFSNPEKINEMKAWELFKPEEIVRLKNVHT